MTDIYDLRSCNKCGTVTDISTNKTYKNTPNHYGDNEEWECFICKTKNGTYF
jgi:hypothetical protein